MMDNLSNTHSIIPNLIYRLVPFDSSLVICLISSQLEEDKRRHKKTSYGQTNKAGKNFIHQVTVIRKQDLNLVHGCNIYRLNKVLELSHLLAELFDGNFVILNDAHQLQLVDAIANRDQLGGSPKEAVHLD